MKPLKKFWGPITFSILMSSSVLLNLLVAQYYVNYCNIAWASTTKIKLHSISVKQIKRIKQALCITYYEDGYNHSKPLVINIKALNLYQLNIFQVLKFMHKGRFKANPRTFDETFNKISYNYPTRFSKASFNPWMPGGNKNVAHT